MQSPDIHFQCVEKHISDNPLVIFHDFQKNSTSPSTAYIKGEVLFADGTILALFQHIRISENGILITDYRYHYMNAEKNMIFRYDNAPHHDEIVSHPHHKHIANKIITSDMLHFKDVMDEIVSIIMNKML